MGAPLHWFGKYLCVGWQQSGDLPCVNRSQVTQKKYPKYGQNCNGRQNDWATVQQGK
ncbi:hypothetical protein QNI22_35840 [Cytophagaceae bacterium BD1B2-1]|uniref:Uncharacterized protein n=1 Tax=Xanthocytophaga agilis TaxID=3048010 RepID=A0AAE3UJL6_9BACT|nr:hypothetical protein [Xanthocytophaga agilis]